MVAEPLIVVTTEVENEPDEITVVKFSLLRHLSQILVLLAQTVVLVVTVEILLQIQPMSEILVVVVEVAVDLVD